MDNTNLEINANKGWKWGTLYGLASIVDGIQFFAPGIGDLLDIPMPFVLAILLALFRIITWGSFFSIIIAGGTDAITGGVFPAWVIDVGFIHWMHRRGAKHDNQIPEQPMRKPSIPPPLYQNSVRLPRNDEGVRENKREE